MNSALTNLFYMLENDVVPTAIYGYHTGRTYEFIGPRNCTQYVSITVCIIHWLGAGSNDCGFAVGGGGGGRDEGDERKVTSNDLGNQQNKPNTIYAVFKQGIWQEVTFSLFHDGGHCHIETSP